VYDKNKDIVAFCGILLFVDSGVSVASFLSYRWEERRFSTGRVLYL